MRYRLMTAFIFIIAFLLIDIYVFQAVLVVSKSSIPLWKNVARYAFWIPTIFCIAALLWWMAADPYKVGIWVTQLDTNRSFCYLFF